MHIIAKTFFIKNVMREPTMAYAAFYGKQIDAVPKCILIIQYYEK